MLGKGRLLGAIGVLLAVAGCTVGPDFRPPCPPALRPFYNNSAHVAYGPPESLAVWWSRFNDPTLERLIEQAVAQNLDLREAYLRVVEARAVRGVVRGELFPKLDGTGGYKYRRLSRNANEFVGRPGFTKGFDLFSAGIDASWQIDVFGKLRRAVEAADAEIGVDVEAYRGVLVTLLADVATNYVTARTLQARLEIATKNLESQHRTLSVVEQRQRAGLVSQLDVAQARSNVHTTAAVIPRLEEELQVTLHRLSVLLGQVPGGTMTTLVGTGRIPVAPESLVAGAPADLLRRRPDIRQAEAEVAVASARIGVAVADLYPQFTLLGTVSVDSRKVATWFTTDSLMHSVGPSVRWNIFSFGRILFNIDSRRAQHEQSIVRYRNTVLNAVAEVENALVGLKLERRRARSLELAVAELREAVKLGRAKYAKGLIPFQTVLDSERQLLRAEEALAGSRGSIVLNTIRAYEALGGGWGPRPVPLPVADDLGADAPEAQQETIKGPSSGSSVPADPGTLPEPVGPAPPE